MRQRNSENESRNGIGYERRKIANMPIKKFGMVLGVIVLIWLLKVGIINQYQKLYPESSIEVIPFEESSINYQYLEANKIFQEIQPIVMKQMGSTMLMENRAHILATTSNYGSFSKLEFVEGGFFTETAVVEGRNHMVLSDELAEATFGSKRAVGNTYQIGEDTYQVVGVYKKHRAIGDYIADTGEYIYIPFYSSKATTHQVDEVIVDTENLEESFTKADLYNLGLNEQNSLISETKNNSKILMSLACMPLMLFILILILKSIYLVGKSIEQVEKKWYEKLVKMMLSIGVIILGLLIIREMIYIPVDALPQENIFELEFYWTYWKEACVRNNRLFKESYTTTLTGYRITKNMLWGLSIVEGIGYYQIMKRKNAIYL